MIYLSQLLGAPVEDLQGERIGKITDVIISQTTSSVPAAASILLIEGGGKGEEEQSWRVPVADVEWHRKSDTSSRLVVRLRIPLEHLSTQSVSPSPREVSLAHEVLDKQVIDIVRKKAVRVNDVCLDDDWHISGVDNSTLGLVRRLAPNWLLGTNSNRAPTNLIPWERIELIGTHLPEGAQEEDIIEAGQPQHSEGAPASHDPGESEATSEEEDILPTNPRLAELHPADIADIVHQLTPGQGARLIESLDDETAADTLEEIDTERQSQILENIRADRAADILEAMEPDEAADLLARLPEERTQELLHLMEPEESEDVQELLEYEENTAGGLMTTDYIALNSTKTVAEALETIRNTISEHDIHPVYVYCVAGETADESPLMGVVSLWELLTATLTQSLQELMETDVITISPDTDPPTVAGIMAKYNLLAVPVVSKEGFLEGIVTVDDALDVLLPSERRRKPTRMY